MFVESCDEDRFFGTFLGIKFVDSQNRSKYEVERFAKPFQSSKHCRRRNRDFHYRRIVKPCWVYTVPENVIEAQIVLPRCFHPIRFILRCGRHDITERPCPFTSMIFDPSISAYRLALILVAIRVERQRERPFVLLSGCPSSCEPPERIA